MSTQETNKNHYLSGVRVNSMDGAEVEVRFFTIYLFIL